MSSFQRRIVADHEHRPIRWYAEALADSEFLVERLCEFGVSDEDVSKARNRRWQRLPLFLHIRAVRP